ncbi:MAG: hypothetical protein FLDDKLPJ_03682 [Phycisphaerae bacterium]|nr:hypothetical protein [Phycisphaerae bacterium]
MYGSSTTTKTRFKTGEESPWHAIYHFDGYLDGTHSPAPTAEEREIELGVDENFPPIRSANKGCWWKLHRRL